MLISVVSFQDVTLLFTSASGSRPIKKRPAWYQVNYTIWLWMYVLMNICKHLSTVMTNLCSVTSLDPVQELHFIYRAQFWHVNSNWSARNAWSVSHITLQKKKKKAWIISFYIPLKKTARAEGCFLQLHLHGHDFNVEATEQQLKMKRSLVGGTLKAVKRKNKG